MQNVFSYAFKGKTAALCDLLDVSHGLLDHLLDRDVITRQQAADCRSPATDYEKATKLLDILERKDDSLYQLFCDALKASQQEHIIDILEQPSQTSSRAQSFAPPTSFTQRNAVPRPLVNNVPAPAAINQNYNGITQGQAFRYPAPGPPVADAWANEGASAANSVSLSGQPVRSPASIILPFDQLPADVKTIAYSELSHLEKIAEGGFGIIHKANHPSWGVVAYKELKAMIISANDKIGRELRREAQSHILRHPNIVPMLAVVFEPQHYGVVLQFAVFGGLDEFYRKYEVEFLTKMSIAHNIILGMNYLHTRNPPTIHGDLKVQNVLVNEGYVAQICDFGLTKWRAFSTTKTAGRSQRGTVTHIPPESWRNINLRRTETFDVYGFAVLLWELLSEEVPFCQPTGGMPNTEQIKAAVMDGQRPDISLIDPPVDDAWKKVATDCIESCWEQDPQKRPSFAKLNDDFENFLRRNEAEVRNARLKLDGQVHGLQASS